MGFQPHSLDSNHVGQKGEILSVASRKGLSSDTSIESRVYFRSEFMNISRTLKGRRRRYSSKQRYCASKSQCCASYARHIMGPYRNSNKDHWTRYWISVLSQCEYRIPYTVTTSQPCLLFGVQWCSLVQLSNVFLFIGSTRTSLRFILRVICSTKLYMSTMPTIRIVIFSRYGSMAKSNRHQQQDLCQWCS